MNKLVARGSKYTDEQRIGAAVIYAAKGTYSAVIREMNIPKSTLSNWSKADWWDDVLVEVRTEKRDKHRAMYSKIVDKAQQQTLKTLSKANAAQAHLIACQATDKVRLHDGMPTSIAKTSPGLDAMVKKFEAIADSYNERQARVVSVQKKSEKESS